MRNTFKNLPRAKQWEIIHKIAKVFAKRGYFNANIPLVCKEAGISTGALYKYFEHKEDIYRSVFEFQYGTAKRLYSLEGRRATKRSVFTIIKKLLEGTARIAEQFPQYLSIYYDLGSSSMDTFCESALVNEELSKNTFLHLVKEGKKRGEINENINDKVAAYIIDNQFMLFGYACVSKFHDKRFHGYFGKKNRQLTIDERIRITLNSIKGLLKKK